VVPNFLASISSARILVAVQKQFLPTHVSLTSIGKFRTSVIS
jgi:hypothetical protein